MKTLYRSYIMLSNAKVTGCYRYRDKFQIIPAPDSFPTMPYAEGHHPCLLELKYEFIFDDSKKMLDSSIVKSWMQERDVGEKYLSEIIKLFDLFSFSRFVEYSNEKCWTINAEGYDETTPRWSEKIYCASGHNHKIGNFTRVESGSIEEIDAQKFYNFGSRYEGADFSIPSILTQTLDKYYGLDGLSKDAFLRSVSLFANALKIRSISPSISFACFVSSIEALVDFIHKDEVVQNCKECSKPKYSVTKKFVEFLKAYSSESTELVRFYKDAYGRRSKILHAGQLFLGEHVPQDWGERDWEQYMLNSGIERVCRIALANWLLERPAYTATSP